MADFRKYTHVERIDRDEVKGILAGHVIVQPKCDGSNSLVYSRNGEIYTGSRTRELGGEFGARVEQVVELAGHAHRRGRTRTGKREAIS